MKMISSKEELILLLKELSKSQGWRLIYTLTPGDKEDEIIAIIVEWFTRHKDYERRFGYG